MSDIATRNDIDTPSDASAAQTAARMTSTAAPGALIRPMITTVLLAVVMWGIVAGIAGGNPPDRLRALTTELRCPLCQSESLAESQSPSARDITAQIREQLDAGWTDAQIKQFYVERYGPSILLDPPRSGGTIWLWIVPLVVVSGGAVAVISRLDGTRTRRRLMLGAAALGAVSVVGLVVLGLAEREPRSAPPPAIDQAVPSRDLAAVTTDEMEAVIAENPTVIGMRLALAQRYVDAGEFDKALRHTTIAVDLPGTDQEYQRTLRLHGWVTALNGGAASGAEFLRAALALSPDDRDAMWFLARVEFSGLGNAPSALEVLDRIDVTGMTAEQKSQVDEFRLLVEDTIASGTAAGGDLVPSSVVP